MARAATIETKNGNQRTRKAIPILPAFLEKTNALTQAQIACRAYEIWQASGCAEGRHEEHWVQAERELREIR